MPKYLANNSRSRCYVRGCHGRSGHGGQTRLIRSSIGGTAPEARHLVNISAADPFRSLSKLGRMTPLILGIIYTSRLEGMGLHQYRHIHGIRFNQKDARKEFLSISSTGTNLQPYDPPDSGSPSDLPATTPTPAATKSGFIRPLLPPSPMRELESRKLGPKN
jgi:hypothetical protein